MLEYLPQQLLLSYVLRYSLSPSMELTVLASLTGQGTPKILLSALPPTKGLLVCARVIGSCWVYWPMLRLRVHTVTPSFLQSSRNLNWPSCLHSTVTTEPPPYLCFWTWKGNILWIFPLFCPKTLIFYQGFLPEPSGSQLTDKYTMYSTHTIKKELPTLS